MNTNTMYALLPETTDILTEAQAIVDASAPKVCRCPVCGRPSPLKKGKGGPKRTTHFQCNIVNSMLNCLETRIKEMIWEDEAHITAVRRRLFQIIARCFNQKNYIMFVPGDNREAADIIADLQAENEQLRAQLQAQGVKLPAPNGCAQFDTATLRAQNDLS